MPFIELKTGALFVLIATLIITIVLLSKNSPGFPSSPSLIKTLILIKLSLSSYILYMSFFAAYFITIALRPFKKSL
jgi:hypothetical protein